MPSINTSKGLWAESNPMEYARQHLEEPLKIWTPPRWVGMDQEEAGYWWTTVPVPEGEKIASLEDYQALLVWLIEQKQQQYISDLQMEGAMVSRAMSHAMAQVKAVMAPELSGEATIENLINFDHNPLRLAILPGGIDCFPVPLSEMGNGTMELLSAWSFIDWINQFQAEVVEGKSW